MIRCKTTSAGVKGGEMKEIKNKIYEIKGLLMVKDRIFPDIPMMVIVTNDKIGCTVSVGSEVADVQFTVPFDRILRDLE